MVFDAEGEKKVLPHPCDLYDRTLRSIVLASGLDWGSHGVEH